MEDTIAKLLALPKSDREALGLMLLKSVKDQAEELSAADRAFLDDRLADFRANPSGGIPAQDACEQLRAELNEKRLSQQ